MVKTNRAFDPNLDFHQGGIKGYLKAVNLVKLKMTSDEEIHSRGRDIET